MTTRRPMQAPPGSDWLPVDGRWQCPACGKQFVRAGLSHSCTTLTLDHHFAERPRAGELFHALRTMIEDVGGPFRLSIARTRIGLINGITFGAVMPRKDWLRFHFLLQRRLDSPRVVKVEHYPPWYLHLLELRDESEIDDELRGWFRESCSLGRR